MPVTMLNLDDEQWDELFAEVDKTVIKAQEDLPEQVRKKAEEIETVVDRYTEFDRWKDRGIKVLGCYMQWTNGPIIIFVGQIYEDCNQNVKETMASVRQVYYHELAHAIGDLGEIEVKERGL